MKTINKKGLWFYGLSGSGKSYASKIATKRKKKSFLIDGDYVRKFISKDLGYTLRDRKIQIRRILGIVRISLKSNLFPIVSTVYMDRYVAKNLRKLKINLIKIERNLSKIVKKHKIYKNKKNVVGKDIHLDLIKSTVIYNSGGKNFCNKIKKLIK